MTTIRSGLFGGKTRRKAKGNKRSKQTTKRKWSLKYKKSINCKRPKGFSQKQYCKYGRKKTRKTKKRQRGGNSEAQKEKDTYLFDAIDISDYDKVENALNNGANVNAKNNDGDTPLICAIKLEDIDMVYLLLERPDINIELDLATNKELQLAEDLWDDMTPEDQEENSIPYAIENYIEKKLEKKLKQSIVAQTIPGHLKRQEDRKNLAMVMSEKDVGNRGDGTMPYELRHEIGKYLGGGKKNRKAKKFPNR